MRLVRALAPLLVLPLVPAAGCGTAPASPGGSPVGHTYLSTKVTVDGRPHRLEPDTQISFEFTDDGQLRAKAGCNDMFADVTLDDGRLDLGGSVARTDMGCDPGRHAQDRWLSDVLTARPTWRLDDIRLVVRTDDTEIVLRDEKVAKPDQPLAGPVWTVDAIVAGEVASSVPAGVAATLEFRDDRVLVFDGCNGGSAGYTASGDTITFDDYGSTLKMCARDIMRLASAVHGILDGTATFTIDGDRLTLESPSGDGLRLVLQGQKQPR